MCPYHHHHFRFKRGVADATEFSISHGSGCSETVTFSQTHACRHRVLPGVISRADRSCPLHTNLTLRPHNRHLFSFHMSLPPSSQHTINCLITSGCSQLCAGQSFFQVNNNNDNNNNNNDPNALRESNNKHRHCSMLLSIRTLLHVTLNMDIAPCYSLYRHCPMLLSIRAFLRVTINMDIAPSYSKHGHCSMLLFTVISPCYSIYGHCSMLLSTWTLLHDALPIVIILSFFFVGMVTQQYKSL